MVEDLHRKIFLFVELAKNIFLCRRTGMDDDNTWTVVRSKHKKKRKSDETKIKIELESLDPLSRAIYEILRKHTYLIPASYITKQVGGDVTKRDVGQILYDGPLTPFVYRYARKRPTLWGLI